MKNRITTRDYELISAYLDNQLSSKDKAHLEARLKAIPELRKELHEMGKTRLILKDVPKLRAPHNYFITPKMVAVPVRPLFAVRLSPVMGIISAVATIMLVLVLFSQSVLPASGPVALAPASIAPTETFAVQPEVQQNIEIHPSPTLAAPLSAMEAPSLASPEPTLPPTEESILASGAGGETAIATPTTIYLFAQLPTATSTIQSNMAISGQLAEGTQITCEEYLKNPGAYPEPIPTGCPTPTNNRSGLQPDVLLTATPTITTTLSSTATETPTSTATSTPSATPTPTETSFPTATATPVPSDTPTTPAIESPSADTGISTKSIPATESITANTGPASQQPIEQQQPVENNGPTPFLVLGAEIGLADIAIASGIAAIIVHSRAGR
jgi:hypothetical protein